MGSRKVRRQLARCLPRRPGSSDGISKGRPLQDLLTRGDVRMVTLVGPGGIGKTRLALEVGRALTGEFDGVVMVPLEEVSSTDLVVSSIASALGVPESPGRSLLDVVISYLRSRRVLL